MDMVRFILRKPTVPIPLNLNICEKCIITFTLQKVYKCSYILPRLFMVKIVDRLILAC